jgi:glycosyltransferase involved in cell wall biosynthesis
LLRDDDIEDHGIQSYLRSDEPFQLLYLGRLIEYKQFDDLLAPLVELEPNLRQSRLEVVGDGPYFEALEQRADELAVSERVVFTGYVNHDEVYDVYDPAESISFFKYQGSPKNIPEHLVGGYPLVATNFGNVSTLLDLKGRSCLRTR